MSACCFRKGSFQLDLTLGDGFSVHNECVKQRWRRCLELNFCTAARQALPPSLLGLMAAECCCNLTLRAPLCHKLLALWLTLMGNYRFSARYLTYLKNFVLCQVTLVAHSLYVPLFHKCPLLGNIHIYFFQSSHGFLSWENRKCENSDSSSCQVGEAAQRCRSNGTVGRSAQINLPLRVYVLIRAPMILKPV